MSWLASGLTQSVTGKISQLSGQLKDILIEGTEEVYDPENELKVVNEKLKENEKRLELLKMECARWEDETNELNLRCQTYEAQLEQRQNEFRQSLISKDSLIAELRSQIGLLESASSIDTPSQGYQKSAFMEEYEEVLPSSDLNNYIHLDKEIKRLKEDNLLLQNENRELLAKIKLKNQQLEEAKTSVGDSGLLEEQLNEIENLKQEIIGLKNRLELDKEKYEQELIDLQKNYEDNLMAQSVEKNTDIERLNQELQNLKIELENSKVLNEQKEVKHHEIVDNLQKALDDQNGQNDQLKSQIKMFESELENANSIITKLKSESKQTVQSVSTNQDSFLIDQLKSEKENLELLLAENESKSIDNQTDIDNLKNRIKSLEFDLTDQNSLIDSLKSKIKDLEQQFEMLKSLNETQESQLISKQSEIEELNRKILGFSKTESNDLDEEFRKLKIELEDKQKENDALQLELKQQQQNLHQEKMLQMQDQKQDKHEMAKLKSENTELKIKLDEKLSEINLLGEQINDLNSSINQLKSNDSTLFNELKVKTEQFLLQIDTANQEIAALKAEKEQFVEQRKQFEFCLDEKSREISQLKIDLDKNIKHISAQSKAIEKLQSDLKECESGSHSQSQESDELALLKNQYNQIYTYLEQKNQESLSYYNEIQRLNIIISDLNRDLLNAKTLNENLSEQYDTLLKGMELEQKMVDDLNEQTSELNTHLLNIKAETDQQKIDAKNQEKLVLKIEELTRERDDLASRLEEFENMKTENSQLKSTDNQNESFSDQKLIEEFAKERENFDLKFNQSQTYYENLLESRSNDLKTELAKEQEKTKINEKNYGKNVEELTKERDSLSLKLKELETYYEDLMNSQTSSLKETLNAEVQQRDKMKKELDRLKEHLVEISESYTKEAIQAEEREKQLRLALNDAQNQLQQQGTSLENSSKEVAQKVDQLSQANQNLIKEKETIKEKLKQAEENFSHQVKVTKNLELVLERLQNEKDGQHQLEISKFQQTIKDQASKIHQLQRENQNCQDEIKKLNETIEAINTLELELSDKDESIKKLQAQIGTKDALIESLEKRFNEFQKINDSYIEKDIIKNLIIGYIKVPQIHEKKQVLKLIGTMLNFSPSELEQAEQGSESKWFGSFLSKSTPVKNAKNASSADSNNKSFTELLIQYVDRESRPKPNLHFDLNKKTDSPLNDSLNSSTSSSSNLPSSESALQFFNAGNSQNSDLTLVNRANNAPNAIPGVSSPAVANSFLEQILK